MEYLLKRISEPSTWAGLSAGIFGLGALFKLDHSEEIASTVATAGQSIIEVGANTESLIMAGAGLLAGIFAILKGEKGSD